MTFKEKKMGQRHFLHAGIFKPASTLTIIKTAVNSHLFKNFKNAFYVQAS